MTDSEGVVYIATGRKYVEEATISAKSLKKQMPNAAVTIITDDCNYIDGCVFDNIITIDSPRHSFADNVSYITKTPYDRTIFLDSDTYISEDISDLFDMLDDFDFAASHDTGRRYELYNNDEIKVQAPDCFPMYNSGVMSFINNKRVSQLFEKWSKIYKRHSNKQKDIVNQPSLREALYKSDVRIATIPPEYNCRLPFPVYLRGKVKVIHGRSTKYETISNILNRYPTNVRRTFINVSGIPNKPIIRFTPDKWQYRQNAIVESLNERGFIQTIKAISRWIRGDKFNK